MKTMISFALFRRVIFFLFIFLILGLHTNLSLAQPIDTQRAIRNYQLVIQGNRKFESFTAQEQNEILMVSKVLESKKSKQGDRFEVIGTYQGCKYFVAEQGVNYSLVEDWLCFKPSRGDIGYGDINSYGFKEVTLNGSQCTIYVDNWLLSKSSALNRMKDKCN